MKKIIFAVLIVLILVAGGFYFLNSEGETNLQNFANSIQQDPNYSENRISLQEVAAHNSKSDCWIVIDTDVLNITSFVDKHPGGEVILQGCGKDATEMFTGVREHMKPLVKMLYQKMIIGKLQS